MNGAEQFEAELQRLKPARPPEEFLERLARLKPLPEPASVRAVPPHEPGFEWSQLLRWLAPASAAACGVGALLLLRAGTPAQRSARDSAAESAGLALKAEDVEINHRLVTLFDAVARLPDGAPVRLRCREWADEVVLVDSAQGIVVEETQPRLEIVPVGFETY